MSKQYAIFKLDDKNFAIKIDHIIEIINFNGVFKIPNTPLYIEGLINLRDTIYTILNLREILNLNEKETISDDEDWHEESPKILLVDINSKLIGLIVDSVDNIILLEDEKIVSASEHKFQFDSSYLEGIAKMKDENMLLLLDVDTIVQKVIDKQINSSA